MGSPLPPPLARAVRRAAARPASGARADAQLFAVGQARCGVLSRQRQAGRRMARRAPISPTSCRLATSCRRARRAAASRCGQATRPVVLLSAGIGVTPVLAMLHALAAEASTREIWWLHGARNGREHPFAAEARGLLEALAHRHSYICYSAPDPADRPGVDFDAAGHLDPAGARRSSTCRATRFLSLRSGCIHERSDRRPRGTGRRARSHPHRTVRRRAIHDTGHRRRTAPAAASAGRRLPARDRWSRSPAAVSMSAGDHRSKACSNWPRRATCRCAGRAGPGCATPARCGLVAGTVSYRPDPLDAPADGNVLICCSRPEGDIVIDL